jgi:nascent polypeptide-associated complex subunit alpha
MKINPRQMQAVMQRMGVSQTEIPARLVIIQTSDKEIIVKNPQVSRVVMMGQEMFQVSGVVEEKSKEVSVNADDVATVVGQTGVSEDDARVAILRHKGDLAAAIMELKANGVKS